MNKSIDIYITEDGYITGYKTVNEIGSNGVPYVLGINERLGSIPYPIGCHEITGIEREDTPEIAYHKAKSKALQDLKEIEENILLGMATETDKEERKVEWLEYHNKNNPY